MQTQNNPRVTGDSIIARSPRGMPVRTFDSEDAARRFVDRNPNFTIQLFRQVVTETEIVL